MKRVQLITFSSIVVELNSYSAIASVPNRGGLVRTDYGSSTPSYQAKLGIIVHVPNFSQFSFLDYIFCHLTLIKSFIKCSF